MEALIVWGICAFICNQLAKSKNRDVTAWTILGFLFSVIAVVVLLVLPKKED